ncbi:MAG TPA: glycoside hydrolase family 97 N-terminal domain-containing protein, partial [Ramlibacter sp.]|nr:glycoside hydrolase family 97 N-terminal domain-containing protein [Ramlibacter sp.]
MRGKANPFSGAPMTQLSITRMRIFLLPLLFLVLVLPAHADTVATVESPGKVLTVELDLSGGEIGYRVLRGGKAVINTSHLGFRFHELEQMRRNFVFTSKKQASFDDTWEQPWGERRFVRNHYNELRARFTEPNRSKRVLDVVFRVYDDGVGFRYEFPDQAQFKDVKIIDELTEFDVAEPATAWWTPAGEWESYEMLVRRSPLAEVGQAHTPMTARTRSGLHLSFHEAALVDYSAMWLRHVGGQKFRAELSPSSEPWKVRRAAPFNTPWRTIQISDRAGGLVESSLILNLNEPNKLGDTSWFKPHKYIGVWWGMHLDTETWGTGPKHGATTANTKRYIDFAARHGFRGILVEGWNKGWNDDWFANG